MLTDSTANNLVMFTANNVVMQLVQCHSHKIKVFSDLIGIVIFDIDSLKDYFQNNYWGFAAKNIFNHISILSAYLFQMLNKWQSPCGDVTP